MSRKVRIICAVIGAIVFGIYKGHWFTSMPQMARAADGALVVGADGNQARFAVGDRVSFSAASLGYDIGGAGDLEKFGPRAVLSFIDPALLAAAKSQAKCSGGCMAGPLNAYESQGRIGHFLLVPANEAALSAMKKADLPGGSKFHISGNELSCQSSQIDGHTLSLNLGHTSYFLVDSIEAE